MFSIIIPLYNKAHYIEKAIQSVLAQTYKEFELIVVNDGSTDNSLELAKNLKARFTSPLGGWEVIDQKNQGVSSARNNGVKLAKYDYIAFLDSDDWWEPTYLETMMELIQEFPEAGIYGCSYYVVKNKLKRLVRLGVEKDFKKGYINYCKVYSKTGEMPLTSISSIVKKFVFEEERGFKTKLKLGEDFDLWLRIALKYPVALVNKPLAYYNQDVDVATKAVVVDKLFEPERHFIFNLDYLQEQEQANLDLKHLLDRLRIYTLLRYRLQQAYPVEVKKEINKVDFNRQPLEVRLNYLLPVGLLKTFNSMRKIGSGLFKYFRK